MSRLVYECDSPYTVTYHTIGSKEDSSKKHPKEVPATSEQDVSTVCCLHYYCCVDVNGFSSPELEHAPGTQTEPV